MYENRGYMRTISVAAAALLLAAACSSAPSGQSAISGQPEDDSPATTTTVAPVATTTSTTTTTVAPVDDSPAKPTGRIHPNCAKAMAAGRAAQEGQAWVFRDAAIDADNDGLIGSDEHYLGTNPDNPDSDGDGFSDGEECRNGTNPLLFALMDPDDPAYLEPKAAD